MMGFTANQPSGWSQTPGSGGESEYAGFLLCSAIIDRSILTDYDAAEVLEVRDSEALRALDGEVRARLVMLLRERAASTTELAEALGIPKGTAGHHVKVLERAGLIRVVATRRVRAVTEKFYGRVARLYVLRTDESPKEVGDGALAAVMVGQAADEIFAARVAPERITAALTHVRLGPADARRMALRVNRLVAAFQALDHSTAALPRRKEGDA